MDQDGQRFEQVYRPPLQHEDQRLDSDARQQETSVSQNRGPSRDMSAVSSLVHPQAWLPGAKAMVASDILSLPP